MHFRFWGPASMASWKASPIAAISTCAATWKASSIRKRGRWSWKKAADGKPRYRGSGKDLSYFDDMKKERYTPHVIEPAAGADRATLAFLCEAYHEDQAPDEKGAMQTRVVLKFHPRLAPLKAAVLPLVKKDGMPEMAQEIYRALKKQMNVYYDEKGAIGRRYRRQDEVGTPFCVTVDGQSLQDKTVTVRDRDSLEQWRVKVDDVVEDIRKRVCPDASLGCIE